MTFADFHTEERVGWGSKAEIYGDYTARITTQAIPALLAQVRTRVGIKLLDICTGPGYAAGAAAAIGAEAEGVDFAPEMVDVARRSFPACRFFEGDALALDVADGAYDAAICPFGIFHFTDPAKAIGEAARIVNPGGRYAFSQWCAPAESPFFKLLFGTIASLADMTNVPPAPDAFAFSDRDHCRKVMTDAGFDAVEIVEVPSVYHGPEANFFEFIKKMSVRFSIVLSKQTEDTCGVIREKLQDDVSQFATNGELVLPIPSMVVSGVRKT